MATEQQLLQAIKQSPFILAPMAGITDAPFRLFMRELGSCVVISELISANGLKYNSEKTRKMMAFSAAERPIGIQLFGEDAQTIAEAAKYVEQIGADFVDLNFGCPVKKVVSKGAGSAVLRDLNQLREILRQVKAAINIPLTIKIRTGWDEQSRNALDAARVAYDEGVTWVTIHGRTRAAGYSGLADWDYIKQVKAQSPLPIIGNGDILTASHAIERLRETGCDAVMIGRGCLKNPFLLQQAQELWTGYADQRQQDLSQVMAKLVSLLQKSYEERVAKIQLRKYSAWYSAGYDNASHFRQRLYQIEDWTELSVVVRDFFTSAQKTIRQETSHENFLMGGHG
jgi:tRNA-dihydrouridine synthase B